MRSCSTCFWGKHRDELDREDKRIFVLMAYVRGIPMDEWDHYVLCTRSPIYDMKGEDDVCENWAPKRFGDKRTV